MRRQVQEFVPGGRSEGSRLQVHGGTFGGKEAVGMWWRRLKRPQSLKQFRAVLLTESEKLFLPGGPKLCIWILLCGRQGEGGRELGLKAVYLTGGGYVASRLVYLWRVRSRLYRRIR